jgi:DNA-binding LacI/PurR family transcriptional regulator
MRQIRARAAARSDRALLALKGAGALVKILTRRAPPLGICCYNDEVAFAVMAALSDADILVPDSVAVIGCDDIPLAQFTNPPLTTVTFNHRQFLDLLIKNILKASGGKALHAVPATPPSVVVRSSA